MENYYFLLQAVISGRSLPNDEVESDDHIEDKTSIELSEDTGTTGLENKDTDLGNVDTSLDNESKLQKQLTDQSNLELSLSETHESKLELLDNNLDTENKSEASLWEQLTDQSNLSVTLPEIHESEVHLPDTNTHVYLENESEPSLQEKLTDQSNSVLAVSEIHESEVKPIDDNNFSEDKSETEEESVDHSKSLAALSESTEVKVIKSINHNIYSNPGSEELNTCFSEEHENATHSGNSEEHHSCDSEDHHSCDLEEYIICHSSDRDWPLAKENSAVVNFLAIEDKYFENGDFCFFLKESDTGQVRLYLKYALNDSTKEIVIPEGEFGKLFTMEWKEDLILESSEELGNLLQNCLVNLEDSVDKLRWEDVVASVGPFHHGNVRLKQSFMSRPKLTSDLGNNKSKNSESALAKNVFNSESGYNVTLPAAHCDRPHLNGKEGGLEVSVARTHRQNLPYHAAVSTNNQGKQY